MLSTSATLYAYVPSPDNNYSGNNNSSNNSDSGKSDSSSEYSYFNNYGDGIADADPKSISNKYLLAVSKQVKEILDDHLNEPEVNHENVSRWNSRSEEVENEIQRRVASGEIRVVSEGNGNLVIEEINNTENSNSEGVSPNVG